MSEMIERVARAIEASLDERDSDKFLTMARAAIEAMREPTEAMLDAGADHMSDGVVFSLEPGEGIDGYDSSPVWTAMIDAALVRARPGAET